MHYFLLLTLKPSPACAHDRDKSSQNYSRYSFFCPSGAFGADTHQLLRAYVLIQYNTNTIQVLQHNVPMDGGLLSRQVPYMLSKS